MVTEPLDPGWRPALPLVGQVVGGRSLDGSILIVMRAAVVFLVIVSAVLGLGVVVFGAGPREARIGDGAARILLSAVMGGALIGISMTGRGGPDLSDADHLAVSVFRITMRRVVFAAAIGPAGMAISWLAGDPSYVIFGTGLAILLMAVAGPSERRIGQFQTEVDEAGSDLSVLGALQRRYR